MKKSILLLSLLLFTGIIYAQQDSIVLNRAGFYAPFQEKLWETPVIWRGLPLTDFTSTGLYASYKKQDFRRTQSPREKALVGFDTHGIYHTKNDILLFGGMSAERSYEKSIPYNLTSERTDEQIVLSPHYYLAERAANWENQHYKVRAGLAVTVFKNITIAPKIHYRVQKFFRTSDPRPEIAYHHYSGELQLGYTLNKHTFYAMGSLGRRTQKNDIDYVNDLGRIDSDAAMQFSVGYGRIIRDPIPNETSSITEKIFLEQSLEKYGLGYAYTLKDGVLNLNYRFRESLEDLYESSNLTDLEEKLFRFRVKEHKTDITFLKYADNISYTLEGSYTSTTGDNYSLISPAGQNFRQEREQVSLSGGILSQNRERTVYNIRSGVTFNAHRIRDFVASVDKKVSSLEISLKAGRDLCQTEKTTWNSGIFTLWYIPVTESLETPSDRNTFMENIILPDQDYDASSRLDAGINVSCTIQAGNGNNIKIYGRGYNRFITDRSEAYASSPLLRESNFGINGGIRFSY